MSTIDDQRKGDLADRWTVLHVRRQRFLAQPPANEKEQLTIALALALDYWVLTVRSITPIDDAYRLMPSPSENREHQWRVKLSQQANTTCAELRFLLHDTLDAWSIKSRFSDFDRRSTVAEERQLFQALRALAGPRTADSLYAVIQPSELLAEQISSAEADALDAREPHGVGSL